MTDLDAALRSGLRAIPDPAISPDFDAAVLAALRIREPWWSTVWRWLAPAVSAGACSLVVTIVIVTSTTRMPIEAEGPHRSQTSVASTPPRPVDIDRLLDASGVCIASVVNMPPRPTAKVTPPDHDAKPNEDAPLRPGQSSALPTSKDLLLT